MEDNKCGFCDCRLVDGDLVGELEVEIIKEKIDKASVIVLKIVIF